MSAGGAALTESTGPSGSLCQWQRGGACGARWQPRQHRPPECAGEAARRRQLQRARISSTVGLFGRSLALWNERTEPRLVVPPIRPEMAGVGQSVDDGGDGFGRWSGDRLRGDLERAKGQGEVYARARARWAQARDHLVAGSSPAMSSRGEGHPHVPDGDHAGGTTPHTGAHTGGLMAVLQRCKACAGKARHRRSRGRLPAGPKRKKGVIRSLRGAELERVLVVDVVESGGAPSAVSSGGEPAKRVSDGGHGDGDARVRGEGTRER
jgi:hypothetical protein